MLILVTSTNVIKLSATHDAFKQVLKPDPSSSILIAGKKTNSGIPSGQPYGFQGTYQGALTRLNEIMWESAKHDYLVSIENGIETLTSDGETTYFDFPVVIVYDCRTKSSGVQFGQSRPIPLEEMRNMKRKKVEGNKIGEWVDDWYQKQKFSQSRRAIIYGALVMALESSSRDQSNDKS